MSAALSHRGALAAAAFAAYAAVTVAMLFLEVPGLGIGHFYYLPVALLGLAGGTLAGAAAGALATGLWLASVAFNDAMPLAELFTAATGIRCVTYVASGALVGSFAAVHRELVERLSDTADRDFLTGLLNTRAFEAELQRRCAQGRRFALLLGDLDGLKQVNDSRGHAEGNARLRLVARVLADVVRDDDLVARVGGDEFAVVAGVGTSDEAGELARRLERALDEQRLAISFGWAVYPIDGGTAIALYRRSDERLYSSKEARRSRVELRTLLPRRA